MEKKRNFVFVYLNTGNGHLAQAEVLREAFQEYAPDVNVTLVQGISKRNKLTQILFEKNYSFSCNYLRGSFPLLYDIGEHRFIHVFLQSLLRVLTKPYLKRMIKKYDATDIVSFHFFMTPLLRRIINTTNKDINLTVVSTDPFTGPIAWFLERKEDYLVSSEEFLKFGLQCGVDSSRLSIVPFLLKKNYRTQHLLNDKNAVREEFGFSEDEKICLIAGGGGGLPHSRHIVKEYVRKNANFTMIVVCGGNKKLKKQLDAIAKKNPQMKLHVYGFVNIMEKLICLSDVVVSKAGASTMMEILSYNKPYIISTYIHNQELGNMRYVVNNHAGYFIQDPKAIYKKIVELFESEQLYEKIKVNTAAALRKFDFNVEKIVKYLIEK